MCRRTAGRSRRATTKGNVLFIDAATGRRAGPTYTTPSGAIPAVGFSPDGTQMAIADNEIRRHRRRSTHRLIRRLFAWPPSSQPGPDVPYAVGTIAFSPDSHVLAADAIRNVMRPRTYIVRWDVATGRRLGRPLQVAPRSESALVGFTAGGARLVTSSAGGPRHGYPRRAHATAAATPVGLGDTLGAEPRRPSRRARRRGRLRAHRSICARAGYESARTTTTGPSRTYASPLTPAHC